MKRGPNDHASRRLLLACERKGGHVEAARQAIADGADVDARDKKGWFPLKYAANPEYGNNFEIVQMLIDGGCHVNMADSEGRSALYRAVRSGGSVSIVEALLRAGANPNTADIWLYTPCHSAAPVELLELLLDAGGDLRKENNKGETPFQFRKKFYNVEHLRHIYEAWTPHRMLPQWEPSVFHLYIEECDGFKHGIFMLLLCLRRYRRIVPKEVGMMIVHYVAEMHRREMWWPAWQDFDMKPYM